MITLHTFTVTVATSKPIAALADQIGNRLWTMDGVTDVDVKPVGQPHRSVRSLLPAHLASAAEAVGAALSPESIEQAEPA